MMDRRSLLLAAGAALTPAFTLAATADALWRALAQGGHVALMRHAATVPGTGDPPDFRLGDCGTQRNLSDAGRRDAAQLGDAFRGQGVRVARVLSSQWCRCIDTGRLMALGPVEPAPAALNSFFGARPEQGRSTEALRALLAGLPRDGAAIVMITHQVNITALTGIFPAQGEIVVLALAPHRGFNVAGRLRPV